MLKLETGNDEWLHAKDKLELLPTCPAERQRYGAVVPGKPKGHQQQGKGGVQ